MRKEPEGGGGGYPASTLIAPYPEEPVGEEWDAITNFVGKIPSLGKFGWKAFELVSGEDIPDYWADKLAGNWDEVATVASATRNLSDFCKSLSVAVNAQVTVARQTWTGEAAEAMELYFVTLTIQLDTMEKNLASLADSCNETAFGIRHCYQTVENIVESLLDALIGICIALAAAAAGSWTGIGGLLGGLGVGAGVVFAITLVNDAIAAMETAFEIAEGVMAVFPATLGLVKETQIASIASHGYINNLVDG
jgi:hypothetical protein